MQLACVFMPSGESAGWGNRLTKSRRFKVSFHLEASETRKQAGWECKILEEQRLVGQLTGLIEQKSAEVILAKRPG